MTNLNPFALPGDPTSQLPTPQAAPPVPVTLPPAAAKAKTHTVRVMADVEVWVGLAPVDVARQFLAALEEHVGHVDGGLDSISVKAR
jgi:hypothetical protein